MIPLQVVGFVPTGWMYEMKRRTYPVREKGPCKIHLVPYSEHSSYNELREYVRFLRPAQVILLSGATLLILDMKARAAV